jgi:hypothetical protein
LEEDGAIFGGDDYQVIDETCWEKVDARLAAT